MTATEEVTAAERSSASRVTEPIRWLALGLAVFVLAVAIYALVELGSTRSQLHRLQATDTLRNSALDAATTYGVYLSSYNYANLDGPNSPWSEVDSHSTPSYRADFDKTKQALTKLVTDYKATATGTVKARGITGISAKQATVLLFIDQTITNSTQKNGPTTQPITVELVLLRSHGKWLIDNLVIPK